MFRLKEQKKLQKKLVSEDHGGVQGGGVPIHARLLQICQMSPFYMVCHLGFWLGNNYLGLKLS